MFRSLQRIGTAVLLALPGIGLAFLAKPLNLGDGFLCFGVLLAFLVPVCWLTTERPMRRPQSPFQN
jgi:uncharacterized membrane protein